MKGVAAIVVAGGTGSRLKSKVHKPFVRLAGRPLLAWTLGAIEKVSRVSRIVLVVHPDDIKAAAGLVRRAKLRKVAMIVPGGTTRMESVANGLKALPEDTSWVAVHDGARPLIAPEIFERTIVAARQYGAAIVAVPVVPTIKSAKDGWVTGTLDRRSLWAVQTPQIFDRRLLSQAHKEGKMRGLQATDDAALVESFGRKVWVVEGAHANIKVTTPEDVVIAEALLKQKR